MFHIKRKGVFDKRSTTEPKTTKTCKEETCTSPLAKNPGSSSGCEEVLQDDALEEKATTTPLSSAHPRRSRSSLHLANQRDLEAATTP
jgi:hypothetical protein